MGGGGTGRDREPPPERLQGVERILPREAPPWSVGRPPRPQTVRGQLRRLCHTLGQGSVSLLAPCTCCPHLLKTSPEVKTTLQSLLCCFGSGSGSIQRAVGAAVGEK